MSQVMQNVVQKWSIQDWFLNKYTCQLQTCIKILKHYRDILDKKITAR